MKRKIHCLILAASPLVAGQVHALGVPVDSFQAQNNKNHEISEARKNLAQSRMELESLTLKSQEDIKSLMGGDGGLKSLGDLSALENMDCEDQNFSQGDKALCEKVKALVDEVKKNENLVKQLSKDAPTGEVKVEPKLETAGEGVKPAINFRYSDSFVGERLLFTAGLGIGAKEEGSLEEAANGFAVNGGNVNFSIKSGWKFSPTGDPDRIHIVPSSSLTYSSVTAEDLDTESGSTVDVDTEVMSATLSLTASFKRQFFIGVDYSYHDVYGDKESDFYKLLHSETTTVFRVAFATDKTQKNFVVLERAHPIGDESPQLRLSFVTSLDFGL